MTRPSVLFGRPVGGSFICEGWEIRVTARCLREDLGVQADAGFAEIEGIEIVKSLVKERRDRIEDTRQVAPLTSGVPVWVLARGSDHRAGTWFDEQEEVLWLLAYGLHRSGESSDFFPYCKQLDAEDRLLPTGRDYARLFDERGERFVQAVRLEAPLILRAARDAGGEQRHMLGGEFGACIAVEVDEELDAEAVTIAFRVDSIEFAHVAIVLTAFHADSDCGTPARAFLLNPIDHALLRWTVLWGVPVEADAAIKVKSFRIDCDARAALATQDGELVGIG